MAGSQRRPQGPQVARSIFLLSTNRVLKVLVRRYYLAFLTHNELALASTPNPTTGSFFGSFQWFRGAIFEFQETWPKKPTINGCFLGRFFFRAPRTTQLSVLGGFFGDTKVFSYFLGETLIFVWLVFPLKNDKDTKRFFFTKETAEATCFHES